MDLRTWALAPLAYTPTQSLISGTQESANQTETITENSFCGCL